MASQSQSLRFKQSLLKVASNTELTKRLKALHDELRDFDQDLIDPTSLDENARALVSPALLLHKDKGVKAYVGCCLVDILRLYAPEAPYTQGQLQSLFEFLVRQFKRVGDPKDPHQSESYYIVDSLATVKSIVLVCDLESGSEQLIEQIFKESFDAISRNSPKNVEIALSDILLSLIEELPSLPHPVIEILVSFFQTKTERSRPAAFDLAVEVCKGASDKLQRYVSQYFAGVIQAAIEGRKDSDFEDQSSESEDEHTGSRRNSRNTGARPKGTSRGKVRESTGKGSIDVPEGLVSAHSMIESLNRHAPSLLLNVIPLLSSELTSTASSEYRRLATTCLGGMFAENSASGDLAASFPLVWKEWMKRTADVTPTVRIAVADSLRKIWSRHAELGSDVEAILGKLLTDADEKVRYAACQVFEAIDHETASHHVSIKILQALGERTVDRKDKVRQIAYRSLGRLFSLAYTDIEAEEEQAVGQFGWIPGRLLHGLVYNDGPSPTGTSASQLHLVAETVSEYVLPLPTSEASLAEDIPSWVDRFLHVERLLDSTASQRQALFSLTRLHEGRGGSVWEAYLQACEVYNGGIVADKEKEAGIKEFLNKTIKVIADKMPDPTRATADLKGFAQQNVAQIYRELRLLLDPQSDLKTYLKNEKDVMRRLGKISDSVAATFTSFIRLSCYTLLSRSSIPQLLKRLAPNSSDPGAEGMAASAHRVLAYIAKTRPILFKSHIAELNNLVTSNNTDGGAADAALASALRALGKLKAVDSSWKLDANVSRRAARIAKNARSVDQAKFAATLVALDETRAGTADDLVESLADALAHASPEDLRNPLAALARIAKHGHDSFEQRSEQITMHCLEILKRPIRAAELPKEAGATWIEDVELHPLTSARLFALKVLTNRCLPFANTDSSTTAAEPVFGLLWGLVDTSRDDENVVSARLRLAATTAVLKLLTTKDPAFLKNVIKNFALLSRTAQDTCFEVRDGYLRKLLHCLRSNRMHAAVLPLFHMSLFLIAHEPDEDLRSQVVQFIKSRSRRTDRYATWEVPFLRLFSLLARHPDFEGEHSVEEYRLMAKYFALYLECLATNENVSVLYHLAQLVKGARDSMSPSFDRILYTLSDLAQHLVKAFAERHNWPLTTRPKNSPAIKLPGDAFKVIVDPAKAKEIRETAYLSDELLKELDVREKVKAVVPRKRKAPSGVKSNPKAQRPSKAVAKSKVKRNEWDAGTSDDDASDDGQGDNEENKAPGSDGGSHSTKRPRQQKATTQHRSARPGLRNTAGQTGDVGDEEAVSEAGEGDAPFGQDRSSVEGEIAKTTSKRGETRTVPRTRRALRGLAQPRDIQKKGTLDPVSDVEESDPSE